LTLKRTHTVLALILGAMLLMAACGGCSGPGNATKSASRGGGVGDASVQGRKDTENTSRPTRARVTVVPRDGATGVDTRGVLRVTAANGKLVSVVVKNAAGDEVDGGISADGRGWRTAETLTPKDARLSSTPASPRSSRRTPSPATTPRSRVRRSASGWRCR
jgi:Bacterial Ig domain